jgi:2-oxoglutarate ferredoxin oxidoreductase subunit alpha
MMNKRMSKLDVALNEISNEDKALAYGEADPLMGLTIISWGSTKGAILDAMDRLSYEGKKNQICSAKIDTSISHRSSRKNASQYNSLGRY